jgi:hypothetical protein
VFLRKLSFGLGGRRLDTFGLTGWDEEEEEPKRDENIRRRPELVDVCLVGLGRVKGVREPRWASWTTWLAEGIVGAAGLSVHISNDGTSAKIRRQLAFTVRYAGDSLDVQRSTRLPNGPILDEIV